MKIEGFREDLHATRSVVYSEAKRAALFLGNPGLAPTMPEMTAKMAMDRLDDIRQIAAQDGRLGKRLAGEIGRREELVSNSPAYRAYQTKMKRLFVRH